MIGMQLGLYQIVAKVGEGGMGVVYRAWDTRLNREVALKVLPDSFANDADRLARFTREAQTLAALNHPNIAAIYGLETGPALPGLPAPPAFIVMELVEGEDLSQRIARLRATGASARQAGMPLDEALPIAKQIAEALEAAHEQGIIHRDLKPANIKVRGDGTVKVLDFGLAKALDTPGGAAGVYRPDLPGRPGLPDLSASPTLTSPVQMTGVGVILGTAAYMAPEQARGGTVDKRADLWAFGVVLFEMLTNRRLFEGATVSDTLAFVLTKTPDWTMLPAQTPSPIRTLLRRCLEKDRKRRLADASDARLEIEEALTAPVTKVTPMMPAAWYFRARLAWTVAAAVVIAAVAITFLAVRSLRQAPPAALHLSKFEVVSPSDAVWSPSPVASTAQVAISPDGLRLAFVAGKRGEPSRVWIRPLDRTEAQALVGTESASFPFWSPDGRFVAFFAGGKLKKIDINGGAPQTLCDVDSARGGSWSPSGIILFAKSQSPLFQVSSAGGPVTSATKFDAAEEPIFHYWPQFFPDGRHFLYLQRSPKQEHRGIYIGSLDSPQTAQVLATEVRGMFAQGHLLFVRDGLLFAQTFDEQALRLSGDPVRIADQVGFYTASYGYAAFDVSASGTIAFGPALLPSSQLKWLARDGSLVANGPRGALVSPRLAADQKTVAAAVRDPQTSTHDIWVFDIARGASSRVTVDPSTDWFPAWMPDGTHLLFASTRDATRLGSQVIYRKSANGIGDDEPVNAQSPVFGFPDDVSLDGQFLLTHNQTPRGYDIGAYPLSQNSRERDTLSTPFNEVQARFSPGGKWVAYASDESGRFEVYVRPFPFSAERTLVSTGGGMQPEWRHDGKELFYISADRKMMAVPLSADGLTLTPGTPRALFAVDVVEPNSPW